MQTPYPFEITASQSPHYNVFSKLVLYVREVLICEQYIYEITRFLCRQDFSVLQVRASMVEAFSASPKASIHFHMLDKQTKNTLSFQDQDKKVIVNRE